SGRRNAGWRPPRVLRPCAGSRSSRKSASKIPVHAARIEDAGGIQRGLQASVPVQQGRGQRLEEKVFGFGLTRAKQGCAATEFGGPLEHLGRRRITAQP